MTQTVTMGQSACGVSYLLARIMRQVALGPRVLLYKTGEECQPRPALTHEHRHISKGPLHLSGSSQSFKSTPLSLPSLCSQESCKDKVARPAAIGHIW